MAPICSAFHSLGRWFNLKGQQEEDKLADMLMG